MSLRTILISVPTLPIQYGVTIDFQTEYTSITKFFTYYDMINKAKDKISHNRTKLLLQSL